MTSVTQLLENKRMTESGKYHLHSLEPAMVYSQGVKSLVAEAEQHWLVWLLDAITEQLHSEMMQEAMEKDRRLRTLIQWSLEVVFDVGTPHYLEGRADFWSPPFYLALCPDDGDMDHFPHQHTRILAVRDCDRWLLCLESEHSENVQAKGDHQEGRGV